METFYLTGSHSCSRSNLFVDTSESAIFFEASPSTELHPSDPTVCPCIHEMLLEYHHHTLEYVCGSCKRMDTAPTMSDF